MANPSINHEASALPGSLVVPYERRMEENWEWAMSEASLFFEGKGKVQETLRRITQRLEKLQIPYAVADGMALFQHGHRRYTEDVDLLVTRENLQAIHEKLDGLGYVRLFAKSKQLRDADTGVKIDFLITGDFPGDGKPKEVSFPDPRDVSEEFNGIRFVNLTTFITLKLTSGMTGANREKDIADVVELVKSKGLTEDVADKLSPSVQSKFREIVRNVQQVRRYVADEQAGLSGAIAANDCGWGRA